jgi:hypothetical protein
MKRSEFFLGETTENAGLDLHFPVFLLARSTIITFCRLVVRAAAAACSYGDKVLFL